LDIKSPIFEKISRSMTVPDMTPEPIWERKNSIFEAVFVAFRRTDIRGASRGLVGRLVIENPVTGDYWKLDPRIY